MTEPAKTEDNTDTKLEPSDKTQEKADRAEDLQADKLKEVQASTKDMEKVEKDPRFKFAPTQIQTAEDAVMAYLREEIDEGELKAACAKFGVSPGALLHNKVERPDGAFRNQIPDELYEVEVAPVLTVDERIDAVNEKARERREALEAAIKEEKNEERKVVLKRELENMPKVK